MTSNLRVILVSPLYGGNVGSVCRAMANMGASDLWLVAPRVTDREWKEAETMAVHAGGILESRHTVARRARPRRKSCESPGPGAWRS